MGEGWLEIGSRRRSADEGHFLAGPSLTRLKYLVVSLITVFKTKQNQSSVTRGHMCHINLGGGGVSL